MAGDKLGMSALNVLRQELKQEPLPDRYSMDIETKLELREKLKKDPYWLHRRFRTELVELADKFDDLDHDLSGIPADDLQGSCSTVRRFAESMEISELPDSADSQGS